MQSHLPPHVGPCLCLPLFVPTCCACPCSFTPTQLCWLMCLSVLVYPHLVVLVNLHPCSFPTCLSTLGCAGWPLSAPIHTGCHLFMLVSVLLLVLICPCLFICAYLSFVMLIYALMGFFWAPEPLVCVCIKYMLVDK